MAEISRRSILTGLIAFVAAPAIVRAGSLMPVKQMIEPGRSGVFWIMDQSQSHRIFFMVDGRVMESTYGGPLVDVSSDFYRETCE